MCARVCVEGEGGSAFEQCYQLIQKHSNAIALQSYTMAEQPDLNTKSRHFVQTLHRRKPCTQDKLNQLPICSTHRFEISVPVGWALNTNN